jgi:cytidine deaminase
MLKMDLGDSFREDIGQGDETDVVGPGAMGLFAASRIFLGRRGAPRGASRIGSRRADNLRQATEDRHAYIVRSLKVPQEIDRLRAIYGDALTVLAINSDENDRRDTLMWKIHESARTPKPVDEFAEFADRLIARDTRENTSWGQYVSEAFSRADVFVDASHPERLKNSIDRIVQILFRYRFHTPTRDEYGMFHAYGASLRSSDLSRQVGASIVDRDGEIVALGTNDVPKAGGGQYWPDQNRDDGRDFRLEKDKSTEIKRRAVDQFLHSLSLHGHIKPPDLTAEAVWDWLEGTDFMNVGEFGRATHAEMSALMHAARRGRPVERCTLYTTTYPCHVCTRHILQAGIERVVFNEPYPKSLARYLHPDSISMGNKAPRDHVPFEPFVGLSPTLYLGVFRAPRGSRRTRDGRVAPWPRRTVRPIKFGDPNSYVLKEAVAVDTLSARLEKRGKPGI